MKAKNISNKIIGFGEVTILPGEEKDIPEEYERNPVLQFYKKNGIATITGKPSVPKKTAEEVQAEKAAAEQVAVQEAEAIRIQRLESVDKMNEVELASLAGELGINPADCKTQAEVLKKVKAALKK